MFLTLILICVPAVADFWTEGRYGAHPTAKFDVRVLRAAIEFVIREDIRTPPVARSIALSRCRGEVRFERNRNNGHVPWVEQAHVNNWIGAF